jgi:hypothetical protein
MEKNEQEKVEQAEKDEMEKVLNEIDAEVAFLN